MSCPLPEPEILPMSDEMTLHARQLAAIRDRCADLTTAKSDLAGFEARIAATLPQERQGDAQALSFEAARLHGLVFNAERALARAALEAEASGALATAAECMEAAAFVLAAHDLPPAERAATARQRGTA
jgi:hypothetical protein